MTPDWLQKLKVGDEVAIGYARSWRVLRIARETPTTWVLPNGLKVRKEDGRVTPRPDGWSSWTAWIEEVTPEIRRKHETDVLIYRARDLHRKPLSLDQLRRIVAILDEGKEAK